MKRTRFGLIVLAALASSHAALGCGGEGVSSDEDAARAYQGLDKSIDKAIALGLDGFNSATNANIAPQSGKGDNAGTIIIGGKVDQGNSSNKTMNLTETLKGYSDDGTLIYDTVEGADPLVDIKLSKIPNGTLDGTLAGKFSVSGELKGTMTLALTFSGQLEPLPGETGKVRRKAGSVHIVGTADSDFGTYKVDVTR